MKLDRITFNRDILGGKACIRGMRISAALVINLVADGMSRQEITEAYPYLEDEDITEALLYGSLAADRKRLSR